MNSAPRWIFAVCTATLCAAASAADIYRWVDDKGVTNMSDVVPDQYRKVAQKVDSAQFEGDERARRARVAAAGGAPSAPGAGKAGTPVPARATAPGAIEPGAAASAASDGDDCATLQRRYKESQDCFGPQPRTISGAINGARSPQCPNVVDPSPKCGLSPASGAAR